jgi:hypothetical protein
MKMTDSDVPRADAIVHSQWTDAIPAYLDGSLPAGAAVRLVAHVAACAGCAFELELERRVAALLDPAHEDAQFERLWARIAAVTPNVAPPRRAPHRRGASIMALAATMLFGAGISWYHGASAPDYTTLGDSPQRACGSLRVQALGASARAAIDASGAHIVDGPDNAGVYTLAAPDPVEALRALRASPAIRLAEPTDC